MEHSVTKNVILVTRTSANQELWEITRNNEAVFLFASFIQMAGQWVATSDFYRGI